MGFGLRCGVFGDVVFGFGGQVLFAGWCVGYLGSLGCVRAWGVRFVDLGGGLGLWAWVVLYIS